MGILWGVLECFGAWICQRVLESLGSALFFLPPNFYPGTREAMVGPGAMVSYQIRLGVYPICSDFTVFGAFSMW